MSRSRAASALAAVVALLAMGPLQAEPDAVPAGWREDFSTPGRGGLPAGWEVKRKFGTRAAVFSLRAAAGAEGTVLAMVSDRATASAIANPAGIDLNATPVLRWRWRVLTLPAGGDGRQPATDDQAIGIYAGTGSALSKRSVSYRWDTVTPAGAEGLCAYGAGTIRIKWFTLRNQDDGLGEWRIEERNLAEDFKAAWGSVPDDIYVSVSCNSQYTGSRAEAELDWIELAPAPALVEPPRLPPGGDAKGAP